MGKFYPKSTLALCLDDGTEREIEFDTFHVFERRVSPYRPETECKFVLTTTSLGWMEPYSGNLRSSFVLIREGVKQELCDCLLGLLGLLGSIVVDKKGGCFITTWFTLSVNVSLVTEGGLQREHDA